MGEKELQPMQAFVSGITNSVVGKDQNQNQFVPVILTTKCILFDICQKRIHKLAIPTRSVYMKYGHQPIEISHGVGHSHLLMKCQSFVLTCGDTT